uniref:NADH-ubiquinone oxidoreductase chain 4L n=2 Tax=Chiridota TaxID=36320 RepID=A0A8E5JZG2_9ECHN|nr:NADH dehydrogenase subunit 4L [Chiridota heheva]QVD42788.1 NADH dehydrogenase subunit 4L [Chiridota heheva]QVD42801.1 NADH dehydrogenase subunit 4L [Chiridota sp. SS-2021]
MSLFVLSFWYIFAVGLLGIVFNRAYIISLLLCLELLVMSLFMLLCCFGLFYGVSVSFYSISILAVNACEASAGLALMVSMSRSFGNTLLFSLNLLSS